MSDSEIDVEAIRQRVEAVKFAGDDAWQRMLGHAPTDLRALLALLAEKDRKLSYRCECCGCAIPDGYPCGDCRADVAEAENARLRQQVEEAAELLRSWVAFEEWHKRRRAWLAQREEPRP